MSIDRYENDEFDRPRRRPARSSGARRVLVLLGVLTFLGIGCCGGVAGLAWYFIKPTSFLEQTQDYAEARKQFRTTLTRHTRAPQPFLNGKPKDAREVNYQSDKLALKAWIGGPEGGLRPAVLFLHGGFALDATDWIQTQPFRDAGFITMMPMLRGENGLLGDFSLFYDEVDDALAAAEALAEQPGVDPNRIYIAGHSAGGTIAMLAAMSSGRFRACASFSGSPDQVRFVKTDAVQAPFNTEDRQELVMRSPLAFPKSFKCPARLYYGDDEFLLMLSTPALAEKAAAAGRDVQSVEVDGDHFTAVIEAIPLAIAYFQDH
ncbi:MAG TPA: alpha/beta fold hydrolase [Gemmataceae bacterium]|jgi:dienelactone hydrolase